MSKESYARGFCKVAEAAGVDPEGLAKFAGDIGEGAGEIAAGLLTSPLAFPLWGIGKLTGNEMLEAADRNARSEYYNLKATDPNHLKAYERHKPAVIQRRKVNLDIANARRARAELALDAEQNELLSMYSQIAKNDPELGMMDRIKINRNIKDLRAQREKIIDAAARNGETLDELWSRRRSADAGLREYDASKSRLWNKARNRLKIRGMRGAGKALPWALASLYPAFTVADGTRRILRGVRSGNGGAAPSENGVPAKGSQFENMVKNWIENKYGPLSP